MDFNKQLKQIEAKLNNMTVKEERTIARRYAFTLNEIRRLIASYYEKYEKDGQLTLSEMMKYDRLVKLISDIDGIFKHHYEDIYNDMSSVLGGVYQEGYYRTAYAIEEQVNIDLRYKAVSAAALYAMVKNPIAGLTLNDRLNRQRMNVIYDLQQKITLGLQQNHTYSRMVKDVKTVVEGDTIKAMRIVRTEGHRVQESSKLDAAAHATANGVIMHKRWNTLEDRRVRHKKANHRKLNDVVIPMEEDFTDGLGRGPAPGQLGAAGSDINCRCFLTYSIEAIEAPNKREREALAFDEWRELRK